MNSLACSKVFGREKPFARSGLVLGTAIGLSGGWLGCGDTGGSTTPATTTTATATTLATAATTASTTGAPAGCLAATAEDGSLSLLADPANNYDFASTVTLQAVPVAPNTPLTFRWSGLSIDLMKQPIDPAGGDVAAVLVSLLELTVQEFQDKLNANENLANYSEAALAFYPTLETEANVYQFVAPGAAEPPLPEQVDPYFDPTVYPPETHTFAVLAQDVTAPARGVRMVQAFRLDPTSLMTEVELTNTSSELAYQTDLAAVVPVQVPAGTANITVDWRHLNEVANNALGGLWFRGAIEEVMIGRYDLTPAELSQQFLGLENIAAELYRGPVPEGSTIHLSSLVEEKTGAPFSGIDDTGTWILALNCLECTNPAPWFLTILQACP